MMKSTPLAAAAVAAFALIAGIAAAETPLPLGVGDPPLRELETAYIECDRVTSQGRADTDTMTRCSQVGEELLSRGFGGDFDGMLAWWRAARERGAARAARAPPPPPAPRRGGAGRGRGGGRGGPPRAGGPGAPRRPKRRRSRSRVAGPVASRAAARAVGSWERMNDSRAAAVRRRARPQRARHMPRDASAACRVAGACRAACAACGIDRHAAPYSHLSHSLTGAPMTMKTSLLVPAAAALLAGALPLGAAAQGMAKDGMLVGPNGMTLYTFDKDAGGKSTCNGPCATNWPPLMAEAGAAAKGDWTVVTRDDGSKQWAYKGKPLYFWTKDQKAGDKTGDGVNSVWHAAKP